MCLLQTGTAQALRAQLLDTKGMIDDVYRSNSDGIGVMYADNGRIRVHKYLPKSTADVRQWLINHLPTDNREIAVHWRMRTHGHINLDNCHPYKIHDGTWLMHNGVLSTGNKADPAKSDTWHFIKDFLNTLPPDTLHNEQFAKLLGEMIDNNRFAIMSHDGRLTVVNREQGIEHDGVWYSNTYAWTPSMLIPGYRTKYSKGTFASSGRWMDEDDYWLDAYKPTHPVSVYPTSKQAVDSTIKLGLADNDDNDDNERDYLDREDGEFIERQDLREMFMEAYADNDIDLLAELIYDYPGDMVDMLLDEFLFHQKVGTNESETRLIDGQRRYVGEHVLNAITTYDYNEFYDLLMNNASPTIYKRVATALICCLDLEFCGAESTT